jgi:DNA ligase (NAD+)
MTEERSRVALGPFSGLSFVVTGTLPTLSRKEMSRLLEEAGGRVAGSVTRATDFLVVGEEAGSKLAKARELGIAELTEADVLAKLSALPSVEGNT